MLAGIASTSPAVANGGALETNTFDVPIQVPTDHAGEREIELVLYEQDGAADDLDAFPLDPARSGKSFRAPETAMQQAS